MLAEIDRIPPSLQLQTFKKNTFPVIYRLRRTCRTINRLIAENAHRILTVCPLFLRITRLPMTINIEVCSQDRSRREMIIWNPMRQLKCVYFEDLEFRNLSDWTILGGRRTVLNGRKSLRTILPKLGLSTNTLYFWNQLHDEGKKKKEETEELKVIMQSVNFKTLSAEHWTETLLQLIPESCTELDIDHFEMDSNYYDAFSRFKRVSLKTLEKEDEEEQILFYIQTLKRERTSRNLRKLKVPGQGMNRIDQTRFGLWKLFTREDDAFYLTDLNSIEIILVYVTCDDGCHEIRIVENSLENIVWSVIKHIFDENLKQLPIDLSGLWTSLLGQERDRYSGEIQSFVENLDSSIVFVDD